ncbi:hypothetical protein HY484_00770, partial [Candidatus Woesearchaeota archaeon]|nr:hypothetical protein [Candidatus Woesearchaeota archaeon]
DLVTIVKDSNLIPKCRDIATKMGVGGRAENTDWATAEYVFEDGKIKIKYNVEPMGAEDITVYVGDKKVFEAYERIKEYDTTPELSFRVGESLFEVLQFKKGEWQTQIDYWHYDLKTDVQKEEIDRLQERFDIK